VRIALVAAGSAILGAAVSGILMLLNNHLSQKSQERRFRQELAVRAGIEDFKNAADLARAHSKVQRGRVYFAPLGHYILHASEMLDLMADTKLNEKEKQQRIYELRKRSEERSDVIKRTESEIESESRQSDPGTFQSE